MKFVVDAPDLFAIITELMGTVEQNGDGKLKRTLPKAHPILPWLYVDGITDIAGLGRPTETETDPGDYLETDAFDSYAAYPTYELTVSFSPVPYTICRDDLIELGTLTHTDFDDVAATVTYAPEWLRYTDYEVAPSAEYITAQMGQYLFQTASGSFPDGVSAGPGQIKMIRQSKVIKFRWYRVPWIYLDHDDSHLIEAGGCVNQHDWYGWGKGTLLYQGLTVLKRYTPPVPVVDVDYGTVIYTNRRLMDLEFQFLHLDRPGTSLPTPTHANDIAAGHNLMPHAVSGKYYFVASNIPNVTDSDNRPVYQSYPFELLFTDPEI